jgi:hypothetical protein
MQAGDALPDVTLFEGTPGNSIKLRDLFAGKKVSTAQLTVARVAKGLSEY